MIVSHKHKFIFIKSTKAASTSIEINLAKHCGKNDIITPVFKFSKVNDGSYFKHHARNHEGFYNHMPADEIKNKLDRNIWDNYLKITITRNPWDYLVSRYWWDLNRKKYDQGIVIYLKNKFFGRKKIPVRDNFKRFLKNINPLFLNHRFYFNSQGKPIADVYIRYESLEDDYKKICDKLKIPYEKLPLVKNKSRKSKDHYSCYYDEESKSIVNDLCLREIEYFGYEFENM